MTKKISSFIFIILIFASLAKAQTAEVSVALNEQFFEALLDAIFKNFNAPEFPLAANTEEIREQKRNENEKKILVSGLQSPYRLIADQSPETTYQNAAPVNCNESIRLLRDIGGVRTAVRFRDGKIYAPIAFSGSYNPPFVGCINFEGWAETNIDLEYDRQSRKLVGRVRVLSVNLGGAANLASGVLSRLVQSSIDKKINPIEILQIDKLSFIVPIQNAGGSLKMKATAVRHEITNGTLNVHIAYEFQK